jgi:hypothetical protein
MSFWHVADFEAVPLPYARRTEQTCYQKQLPSRWADSNSIRDGTAERDHHCCNGDGTDQAAAVPIKVMRRNARLALIFVDASLDTSPNLEAWAIYVLCALTALVDHWNLLQAKPSDL